MADYVVAQAAVLIVPTTEGFKKKLEAELRRIQTQINAHGGVEIEASLKTKEMLAKGFAAKKALEKDPVKIKFRIVDATKSITEIRHKYEDLARETKKGLLLNLKIAGMSLLPQLAQGLAAVNASMVQLTQSALVLPGILSGALSSFGALATGLSGVKGAFKEYGDAQKNAAQEGLKARNSAKNVQNAYRDLGRSIKDAKRNLEDLNAQLRDAPLDEADAIIQLTEARAEAADTAKKSGLQQQKDALAVLKAENQLVDVRLRNSRLIQDVAEANAKGVAGADAVTEATDRLSKAQDEAATQSTKLSDSLKQLSPNAQAFIQAMTGMQGKWNEFKNSTQDRLFAGLDQEVTKLAQVGLPTLQRGFGSIADSLNGNVKAAIKSLESDTNQGFLDKIFGDTAAAQANMSKIFDPFIDALLRLSATGTDFLPRLVDGLVDLTTRFDSFIVRAEGDGSLEKWINQGIDEFNALGNSIINVGSMLASLSEAFTGSGGRTFLQVLEDGTKSLAEFLKSGEGQNKLKKFFSDAREEFAKWSPLLDQLPGLFSNVSKVGQQWADMWIPKLTSMASLLANHPNLVSAIFKIYMTWKTVVPVIKGVSSAIDGVKKAGELLNTHVFQGAQGQVGKYATAVGTLKGKLGAVREAILGPVGVMGAATAFAGYLTYNLIRAHDEAGEAARRQAQDVDNLTSSLTAVTGAATEATKAVISKNLRDAANTDTGKGDPYAFVNTIPDQAQRQDIVGKTAAGDVAGALAQLPPAATADSIEQQDFWPIWKDSLLEAGLTPDIIAKAVNGEPASKKKFDDWYAKQKPSASIVIPIVGGMDIPFADKLPPNVKRGLETSGIVDLPPDLLDIQNQLPEAQRQASEVQNEIYSNSGNMQQGGDNRRDTYADAYGRARLKPQSPFNEMGVLVQPGLGPDGGELIVRSAPKPGSTEAEKFRNDGVLFQPDGPNRYIVTLDQNAVDLYFDKYASGGLISGPGSGTSDSILARLSHGEYVVNAASTSKHLPLLEQINSGGMPGFAGGGLLGDAFAAPKQPEPPKPPVPPGGIGSWLFQLPAPPKPAPSNLIGNAGAATFDGDPTSGGLGPLLGTDSSLELDSNPYMAPGENTDPITGSPLSSVFSPKPVLDAAAASAPKPAPPVAPKPVPSKPSVPAAPKPLPAEAGYVPGAGGTISTSADASVNPNTTVHGLGGLPGPKPNATTSASSPGIPVEILNMPTLGPALSEAVSQAGITSSGSSTVVPAVLPPTVAGAASAPVAVEVIPGVTPEVNFGAQKAASYGLHVSSALREGETGSYHAIGQAGDYSNQVQFGPPTPEMTAFANDMMARYAPYIDELIYAGSSQNVYQGKLVPAIDMPGSPYTTAQAKYHGDHVHIAWKPGALAQLVSSGDLPAEVLSAGSPSNMAMADTPTGVPLPQVTYGDGTSADGENQDQKKNGIRLPTPEEYAKYVSESWMKTLQGLVQNAGKIALNFVGSFFGLDLSRITGLADSVINGIDLPGMDDDKNKKDGSSATANLPANSEVASIIESAEFKRLPPSVQQAYLQAYQNPSAENLANLQKVIQGLKGQGGSQSSTGPTGNSDIQNWLYGQLLSNGLSADQARGILAMNAVEGGAKDVRSLLGFTESQAQGPQAHVAAFMKQWNDMSRRPGGKIPGVAADGSVADWNAYMEWIRVKIVGQTGVASDWQGNPQPNPNDYQNRLMQALNSGGSFQPWTGSAWPSGQKPPGFDTGGKISGPGTGRSDSIIARVSNGEYIVNAGAARKHAGLLDAINSGQNLPGFADGGAPWLIPPPNVPPPAPPPVTTPDPPPAPVPPDPQGPQADAAAGVPSTPTPEGDQTAKDQSVLKEVGAALGGIGAAVGGVGDGAAAPAGGTPEGDPRSEIAAAPQNLDHVNPAIAGGIQAAGAAISGAISTAVQAGSAALAASGNPQAGAALGSASGIINGLVNAGSTAVVGAVNVLSSLGVSNYNNPANAGGYGTAMTPEAYGQKPYTGPTVVNNWNGGVHTSNNEEFYKLQQRRELQNASGFLPANS